MTSDNKIEADGVTAAQAGSGTQSPGSQNSGTHTSGTQHREAQSPGSQGPGAEALGSKAQGGPELQPPPPPDMQQGAKSPGPVPLGTDEEIARLKAEAADYKDRLLRAHAEMDNVRKRLEREKADASRFAITKFARDVVGVGDNVQRAIDAVPHLAVEQDPALRSFVEGVTMIEREFLSVLERHGIKRLDPKGEQFNPHHHQAVMEMPSPDVPSGTVTQVFQAGYMIEDRVLRPAMVAVARGGLKPAAPAPAAGTPSAAGPTDGNGPGRQG